MSKVWFPKFFLRLIKNNSERRPPEAVFHVSPSMTKHEVKEYLTKIYKLPVISVATTNFLGSWKRLYGRRRITAYRQRNYKQAVVKYYLDPATIKKAQGTV